MASLNISGKVRLYVRPNHIREGCITESNNCAIAKSAATYFGTSNVSVDQDRILVQTGSIVLELTPTGESRGRFGSSWYTETSHRAFVEAFDRGDVPPDTRVNFTYNVKALSGVEKNEAIREIKVARRSFLNALARHRVTTGQEAYGKRRK